MNEHEATAKIFESIRSLLPMSSGVEIPPGETTILDVRSRFTEFTEKMVIVDHFEIDKISLSRPSGVLVLRSRDRDGPIDLASIDELLCHMIVPRGTGIAFSMRNIGDNARAFVGAIVSRSSIMDHREDLLNTMRERKKRPEWWSENHQRLIDLPEEEARRIEGTLMRCPDGSPRHDYSLLAT